VMARFALADRRNIVLAAAILTEYRPCRQPQSLSFLLTLFLSAPFGVFGFVTRFFKCCHVLLCVGDETVIAHGNAFALPCLDEASPLQVLWRLPGTCQSISMLVRDWPSTTYIYHAVSNVWDCRQHVFDL
jgi:hypothetical protein